MYRIVTAEKIKMRNYVPYKYLSSHALQLINFRYIFQNLSSLVDNFA